MQDKEGSCSTQIYSSLEKKKKRKKTTHTQKRKLVKSGYLTTTNPAVHMDWSLPGMETFPLGTEPQQEQSLLQRREAAAT